MCLFVYAFRIVHLVLVKKLRVSSTGKTGSPSLSLHCLSIAFRLEMEAREILISLGMPIGVDIAWVFQSSLLWRFHGDGLSVVSRRQCFTVCPGLLGLILFLPALLTPHDVAGYVYRWRGGGDIQKRWTALICLTGTGSSSFNGKESCDMPRFCFFLLCARAPPVAAVLVVSLSGSWQV